MTTGNSNTSGCARTSGPAPQRPFHRLVLTMAGVAARTGSFCEGTFADFGCSVYGSLVAVWIAERDDGAYWDAAWRTARSPRAQRWLSQIAPRFDALFGGFDYLGHMSNGESVYRRRAA